MTKRQLLERNWRFVRERIDRACDRAKRARDEVKLVAVTKSVGVAEMQALLDLGAGDLGENRVQDAARKFPVLRPAAPFCRHLIGHLQRNKVRLALDHFDFFHSLDSLRLAMAMESEAARAGRMLPVLLQVNVSGEVTKQGWPPGEMVAALPEIRGMSHLRMEGLMTMAPLADDPELVRPMFRQLRELREANASSFPGLRHLSMGMTQDFEVAIEEGATLVRIGTALFEGLGEGMA
ncbi:MAG: YggS family pyridoxal phosphate-dependent enzyme [Planctomycetes bacterium]|nr:YggS family pyridoxal phosphate-dependent enzyme [Planctomycetota bacterium]